MSSFDKNILYKRNVILIPADYDGVSNQKGIMAVEQKENGVVCTLKCYNLKPTDEKYTIGISIGGKSFKTQATAKEMSNLKLQINEIKLIASKISCVIVSLTKKSYETLLWGSTETTKAMAESYFIDNLLQETNILQNDNYNKNENDYHCEQMINSNSYDIDNNSRIFNNQEIIMDNQSKVEEIETNSHIINDMQNQLNSQSNFKASNLDDVDENGFHIINQQDEKINQENDNFANEKETKLNKTYNQLESEINKNSQKENCFKTQSYQTKFDNQNYNSNQKQEEIFEEEMFTDYIDKVIKQTEDDGQSSKSNQSNNNQFYFDNKATTNSFYDKVYDQVQDLFLHNETELMLEKIIPESKFCKVQNGDEYYVFGVIYQQGNVKCICYGIPSDYSVVPPKEIDGYCQWLPLDANNYKGKGYWLTYQDAVTGENISVEII